MKHSRHQRLLELVSRVRTGEVAQFELLDDLRGQYHSVHAAQRDQAIQLLARMAEPERTRELMHLYRTCGWRETRLSILHTLGSDPTERGIEFLILNAAKQDDLSMAQAAIAALGRSHSPLAARFLASHYEHGPAALRPYIVYALGEIPDRSLVQRFREDLMDALGNDRVLLAQSLILALGELKDTGSRDLIWDVLETSSQRNHVMSSLLAMGKFGRDTERLAALESQFRESFLDWQIYDNVRDQIKHRDQWTLDDYFDKLFDESRAFDENLVLEFDAFEPERIKPRFIEYVGNGQFARACEVYGGMRIPNLAAWFDEIFLEHITDEAQLQAALSGLRKQYGDEFFPVIWGLKDLAIKSSDDKTFAAWVYCLALVPVDGLAAVLKYADTEDYAAMTYARKVMVLNRLAEMAIARQGEPGVIDHAAGAVERLLLHETDKLVQARTVRVNAQLSCATDKTVQWMSDNIGDEVLAASCLFFMSRFRNEATQKLIEKALALDSIREYNAAMLVRALTKQKPDANQRNKPLDAFLRDCLDRKYGDGACAATLELLASCPRRTCFPQAVDLAEGEQRFIVPAIVALRAFKDPRATTVLSRCLRAPSESIAGRALDALTYQPDDRAKGVLLNFLEQRVDDYDLSDKIIRSLDAPIGKHVQFARRIDKLIENNPNHLLRDELVSLRDRLMQAERKRNQDATSESSVHNTKVDSELTRRIPAFEDLDEVVQATLRTAELPYLYPELFHGEVDKSTTVIEYCKATDLFLEKHLGQRQLFPRLRDDLPQFQNLIFRAGLDGDYPNPNQVAEGLELGKEIIADDLPISKMQRIAHSILTGRILNEQWKVLDGLRAWGIVLLLFVRHNQTARKWTPIRIPLSNSAIFRLAQMLFDLQELRNPVAHRATLLRITEIEVVREDITKVFEMLAKAFLK